MASLTKQHTVPETRNENQARTAPREPTTKNALEHFQEYRREPRNRGPMVLRHWLRTRLETQAVVSGHADHPDKPWVPILAKTSAVPTGSLPCSS